MVTIEVLGTPAPKGSYRAIPTKKGTRLVPMSKREKPWRQAVAQAAAEKGVKFAPHVPLVVKVLFFLPRPKTVTREYPTVSPDIDKLLRSTFDGLQDSHIIDNDAQIVRVYTSKDYDSLDEPGCTIIIEEIP